MLRPFRSVGVIGLSVIAFLVASTGLASAHAQYQSSTPPANSTVSATPSAVQVTWTQELASIKFTITGPDGSEVTTGAATIDLKERHNASVPIRDAGPGQYLVLWHNVSGDDGDPNDGSFVFTVAGTPTQNAVVPTSPNPPAAGANPPAATNPAVNCIDNGIKTPGIADFRVDTYCKRRAIRDQYKGKIKEVVFDYDLSIGMGLESSLADAMGGG